MNIRLKQLLVTLLLLFSFFKLFAAGTMPAVNPAGETFSLNQLSKMDIAVLQGNRASYAFYIPIPSYWQVTSLDLNLIIQFSPLLLNTSSLTLMAGDIPVDTIKLDKNLAQPISWKVTIPQAYITPKITTISIVGDIKTTEELCKDTENQGNWATLSGNSTVTYFHTNKPVHWSLQEFPYPFIHKNAPFFDKVAFFLPIKMGANDFAPYFKLANILAKKASWRGVGFDTNMMSNFNGLALSYPSVIIGTPEIVDFSSLGNPDGLQLKEKQWAQSDGKILSADEGFIWLTTRNQQPLLIISANTSKGLATAVESINSRKMQFMADNASFFIAQPESKLSPVEKKKAYSTFLDLGYKDNVVFGTGQNQLNYQFNLPAQYTDKPVKLILNYSHSPFLQKDRPSTMSISLNGLPLDGAILKPGVAKTNVMELKLPAKLLLLGKNTLTITFNLLLPEKMCSKDYANQAWGTIYATSSLQFYGSEYSIKEQIKSYSDLLSGAVLVGLPHDPTVYEDQKLLKSMLYFATMLDKATSLDAMDTQSLQNQTGQQNLIYFATGNDNSPTLHSLESTFNQLVKNLDATSVESLKSINKSILRDAFTKSQYVGFVGISSVGTDKKFSQLILFGFTPKELGLAVALLNDTYKRSFLTGNLAVAFQNGAYTNLSSHEIEKSVQTEVSMTRLLGSILKYTLYGLAVFVLGLLVYVWRKKRQAK